MTTKTISVRLLFLFVVLAVAYGLMAAPAVAQGCGSGYGGFWGYSTPTYGYGWGGYYGGYDFGDPYHDGFGYGRAYRPYPHGGYWRGYRSYYGGGFGYRGGGCY